MKKKKKLPKTASHITLYIILGVYLAAAVLGAAFVIYCIAAGDNPEASQALIALFGYTGLCGSSTIIVYTAKASKENERKLENDKYRVRLEMAKQVFRETADGTLDEKSIALLRSLLYEQEYTTAVMTVPSINESEGMG